MYGTVDKLVEIYNVRIKPNAIEGFELELRCINADKPVLTHLHNPRISELKGGGNRGRHDEGRMVRERS